MGKTEIAWPPEVAELIEWDREDGLTVHTVDKDTHELYTIVFVPRGLDNFHARTVRRHEFLHAVQDDPRKSGMSGAIYRNITDYADQGVADSFVHEVYWPVGVDAEADKEAVQMAFADLTKMVGDLGDRANWDEGATLVITLRSMAILQAVGSIAEQLKGSRLVLQLFEPDVLERLSAVLARVKAQDRAGALQLFNALVVEKWPEAKAAQAA